MRVDSTFLPRGRITTICLTAGFAVLLFLAIPAVNAVEELSAQELKSHCARLNDEPEGADAQYCIRYIQGFIDGAVATDARVMLSAEGTQDREETFSERAKRTRLPSAEDRFRAANLAGFCLGDPLPIRNVVDVVAADLAALPDKPKKRDRVAMDFVYASLQKHFPCGP